MKVSFVTNRVASKDAVGNNHIYRAAYLLRQGHEVCIYCNDYADIPPGFENRIRRVTLADLSGARQSLSSASHLALAHFTSSDLFIYDYALYYDLVDSIAWPKDGVTLFDYHGVTPPELWGTEQGVEPLRRGVEATALVHYADYAIVHSDYAKEELVSRTGFDPDRIFRLGYPIHLGRFYPAPKDEELARFWGLEDGPVLLFVGRMAGNKRLEVLVEALKIVNKTIPNAKLLLVGENKAPPYDLFSRRVQLLAKEYGLEQSVIFTGKVPDDLLPRYYNLADVYVTSSLHECFCVPIVEAMACGKPVVGADTTAIPFTLGDAGLTFPPEDAEELADKVVQVLTSEELYARLVAKGLERAQMFSLERYEQQLDCVLQQVSRGSSRGDDTPEARLRLASSKSFQHELQLLAERAPLSIPYRVRSDKPLIGPLVVWVRNMLTVHLKVFYIDRIVERQGLFNSLLVNVLRALVQHLDRLTSRLERAAAAMERQEQVERALAQVEEELSALRREVAELKGKGR